jgi:hypothetical protein
MSSKKKQTLTEKQFSVTAAPQIETSHPKPASGLDCMDLRAMFSTPHDTPTTTSKAKPVEVQPTPTTESCDGASLQCHRREKLLSDMPQLFHSFPYTPETPYTGNRCWWDSHPFEGEPICIPTSYDIKNRVFKRWHGAFCSWECAFAYARTHAMHQSIPFMYQIRLESGMNISVNRAPHFSELQSFGGNLSIDNFRING